ncbi:unnamed protein product [Toxocara canis]|uniref:GATA-type domain-containing protein n=1 Tax=Toxocara canis TaxID=6265 RepID=A0A183UKB8_TOXCA|nr:unnamed protein product [Toxocara canis]
MNSQHCKKPLMDNRRAKLQLDDDGTPICMLCDEKLPNEREWAEHIEMERAKLIKSIIGIKEQKVAALQRTLSSPAATDQSKRKREYELMRIRANQQKRLGMKNVVSRDPLPSLGRPSNSDSPSCSPSVSAFVKKEETEASATDKSFCKSCERHHEYLIISNSFDQPRCQECFMKLRAQTSALPLTITSSPMDSCSPGASSEGGAAEKASPHSPLSLVVDSKRAKID